MQLQEEVYDIVIIGGGAVGSGILLDATLRGYKVVLLEKNDFASGASSKSSKLVHGGVRYLEKAIKQLDKSQYNLVKEALEERAIFLENASNISNRIKIFIPIYSYLNLIYTSIGLFFYRLLSGEKNLGKNHYINKLVTSVFFSNIKNNKLKGCVSFYDGSFLDFKMVISLLQTANLKGAQLKNYCEANEFLYENEKISAVRYLDKIQNKIYEIKTKVVINATGANVDNIRLLDNQDSKEILALSSGIHIVISKDFLDTKEAILIPNTSDGRVVFILPYLNYCLIGTTDNKTIYEENPKVKEFEIKYLLKEVNKYFNKPLTKGDILSSWSGIRPLVKSDKSSTQQMVREHILNLSKSGLLSIVGGKWTTYRKMAQETIDFLINNNILEKKDVCKTKEFKLVGNNKDILNETEDLMSFYSIKKETQKSLVTLYGTNAINVLNLANEIKNFDLIHESLPYLKAEIDYCIKYEFVKKPIDFLARRIGLCFLHKDLALNCVNVVCEHMGNILSLSEEEINKSIVETDIFIKDNF